MRRLPVVLCLLLAFVKLEAGRVKRPCPDFTFISASGRKVDLKEYRGKVVTLEVMLTTCPNCKRCAQTIQRLYDELGPKGYQPVAVAVNDGAEEIITEYARVFGLEYPVGACDRDSAARLLRHPVNRPMFVPQLVFIDKQRTIRAVYGGEEYFFRKEEANIRALVEQLLSDEKPQ